MSKVFCFGELLMRMSPQLQRTWIHESSMPVYIGGAELNVAKALSLWEVPVGYCTALPDNAMSADIHNHLEQLHIDTGPVMFIGKRIGIYYLPQGADMKSSGVIYDRAHSSFSMLEPGQIDWKTLLQGYSWFHFSAINPALNQKLALVCEEGLKAATELGLTISVDLNYRSKLWQYGKEPDEVMPDLVKYCHVIMGNIWAAEKMLGIKLSLSLEDEKESYVKQARETSRLLIEKFPTCRQVANTFRFDIDEGLKYYACLYENEQLFVSLEQQSKEIVDRVGSGDTFMAGLIYSNLQQFAPQEIIEFAAGAAFNKLFIKGDATTSGVEEIKKSYLNYV